jgi:hypothetical protein
MITTQSSNNEAAVPGAAIDANRARRPGVPMETEPRPVGSAHWAAPERQTDPGNVLKRRGLSELTPVFGTSVAPRGISGAIRRAAYDLPEHYATHWLLLLLSDRIDALEGAIEEILPKARLAGSPLRTLLQKKPREMTSLE